MHYFLSSKSYGILDCAENRGVEYAVCWEAGNSLSLVQCLQLFLSARFYSDCPANNEMPLHYN